MANVPATTIYGVYSREILDSRGSPTVETTVILDSGYRGTACVPSGASVGTGEAFELRDKDPNRYLGMGVLKAIANVNAVIGPAVKGKNAVDQKGLDELMISLDGTENKSKLGANAILSVSLAAAVATSQATSVPLYRYLNFLYSAYRKVDMIRIPSPLFNVVNGGKHASWNLDFQEFHIIPASNKPFSQALQIGVEIYNSLKDILINRNASHNVGDEGGFAPTLFTNIDGLEVVSEAIRNTPYRLNMDVFLGLDLAASNFKKDRGYHIKDRPVPYTANEFIAFLKELYEKYHLLLLEDALEENDWASWTRLTGELGKQVLIVGDDLCVTNPKRLEKAITEKSCTALIIKPNQIGTLTEVFRTIKMADDHDIKTVLSHRSGETNDTFIADLAVAVQSDYVKFGAPARGERIAKYNRLLQIETELLYLAQKKS